MHPAETGLIHCRLSAYYLPSNVDSGGGKSSSSRGHRHGFVLAPFRRFWGGQSRQSARSTDPAYPPVCLSLSLAFFLCLSPSIHTAFDSVMTAFDGNLCGLSLAVSHLVGLRIRSLKDTNSESTPSGRVPSDASPASSC